MSTIVTDTITGKSTATTVTIGSTPVVSSSANSMTIRGEGSNQTNAADVSNSPTARDSLNISSTDDDAAGKFTNHFTNNFAAAKGYTAGGNSCDLDNQTLFQYQCVPLQDGTVLSDEIQMVQLYVGASASGTADNGYSNNIMHGALA
jgi:hypothetical protein